jgi:two-component system response regulator PilR (NtrC family)
LVVDDEQGMRELLEVLVRRVGHEVDVETGGQRGVQRIADSRPYDLIITDLVMPGTTGLEVLKAAKDKCVDSQVIVVTAYSSSDTAVRALRSGAYDYVSKPFKVDEMRILIERALEKRRLLSENVDLRAQVRRRFSVENIVGASAAMRAVLDLCQRLGPLRTNVLIAGESGTGKELVARALHALGPRAAATFVSVNCGALPENLMESELFGHVQGAFTGALRASEGLFRRADGGTLFLDEVGEVPLPLQVKLLRAIQERSVRPVGGTTETSVDVRIVAASNRDLHRDVEEGKFRSDLYYRLNVVRIDLPPLRDRREDIPALLEHFVARYASESGRLGMTVTPAALKLLLEYDFPGNVRELENVVERAVALALGEAIDCDALPAIISESVSTRGEAHVPELTEGFDLDQVLESLERTYIAEAMRRAERVQKRAAKMLGISFRSFRYRVRKLGIDVDKTR